MINEQAYSQIMERLSGWESNTLTRIGKRIKATGKISATDATALKNISDIKGDLFAIQKELETITNLNNAELLKIYKGSISDQNQSAKELAELAGRPFVVVPYSQNKAAQRIVENVFRKTASDIMNFSNTKALGFTNADGTFTTLEQSYKNAVDKAILQVTSGTTDFNSAMRDTLAELGGSGVRVQYGNTTRRLDSAVRQNMLWGNKQVYQNYDSYIGNQLGCDIFFVDAHPASRPSHEFMQGGQFSMSGDITVDGEYYPDGTDALSALDDYNCLHTKSTGIAGISENPYSKKFVEDMKKQDNELIDFDGKEKTRYEYKQDMRKIETAIRQQKDTAVLASASGNMELRRECQAKINALQDKYDKLTTATGLQATPERYSVAGFRKVKAK